MVTHNFGARCAEMRKHLGMSKIDFARKIGMHRTYYSSVEAGTRNPCLKNMVRIAAGFGISLAELFGDMEGIVPNNGVYE